MWLSAGESKAANSAPCCCQPVLGSAAGTMWAGWCMAFWLPCRECFFANSTLMQITCLSVFQMPAARVCVWKVPHQPPCLQLGDPRAAVLLVASSALWAVCEIRCLEKLDNIQVYWNISWIRLQHYSCIINSQNIKGTFIRIGPYSVKEIQSILLDLNHDAAHTKTIPHIRIGRKPKLGQKRVVRPKFMRKCGFSTTHCGVSMFYYSRTARSHSECLYCLTFTQSFLFSQQTNFSFIWHSFNN